MRTFRKPYLSIPVLAFLCLLSVSLSGCVKNGRLDEGDCKCTVTFVDIPKEFSMLEENLQENFAIHLTLRNLVSEKLYDITLDRENAFEQDLYLHPGTYQVYTLYASQSGNTGLNVTADAENIELSRDKEAALSITVENAAAFTEHWMSVQPMPEMLLADKYSGLIQINRQVIKIQDIVSQLNLSHDGQVPAYKKLELTDTDKGVCVTLQNSGENPINWQDCDVIGIRVFKNNVVFPEGVTLGMSVSKVCHAENGLYGEPDNFTGSLLYGWDWDASSAVYKDPATGNCITLELAADGSAIDSISYQLALFE